MIVMGRDLSVLVGVADRQRARGVDARVLGDGESLLESFWEREDDVVVVVDALDRLDAVESEREPVDWDAVVRLAKGPRRPRVVWCTSQPKSEQGARLRKSGVAYTIVHAGMLVCAHELGLGDVEGRTVHVLRDLPVPDCGLTPLPCLLEAIEDAVASEHLGHTFDARITGPDAWARVIEALGGRPKVGSRAVARMMGWVGRPVLTLRERREETDPPLAWIGGFDAAGGFVWPMPAPSHTEVNDESSSAS